MLIPPRARRHARKFCSCAVAYLKAAIEAEGPAIAVSRGDSPVFHRLENGLCVAYLVDAGDSFTYVQHRHLHDARMSQEELRKVGLGNLERTAAKRLGIEPHGPIHAAFLDGNF